MTKEYELLTTYKENLRKMEAILDNGESITDTFISNYDSLKETIVRMSSIKANNAKPFEFNYEIRDNGIYKTSTK